MALLFNPAAGALRMAGTAVRGAVASVLPRRTEMTRAVVLEKHDNIPWKGEINIRNIDVVEPFGPRDLKIAIKSVGICGSDVHYYKHGHIFDFIVDEPMILGHEAAGVVVAVGEEVANEFNVGDRVCMEPGIPHPHSRATREGMYNLCDKLRFWATPPTRKNTFLRSDPAWRAGHGCLRPEVVHPADFTYKLPDNVSFDEGAMVEPFAVGMQAAVKARITPGQIALVIGAGPIGCMTALAALGAGCAKVYITDIAHEKLVTAERLRPGQIVGTLSSDVLEFVQEETRGWGVDVVFECSGNAAQALQMGKLACPRGVAVFVGCPANPVEIDVGDLQVRELRTQAVFRYSHVYQAAINLVASNAINIQPIITDRFNFEDSVEAFNFMCDPPASTIKTIIQL